MKKGISIGMLLLICIIVAACSSQKEIGSVSSPPVSLSSEPSLAVTADSVSNTSAGHDVGSMSYEEYFSKERKFYWDATEEDEPYLFFDEVFSRETHVLYTPSTYAIREADGEVVVAEYTEFQEIFGARAVYCVNGEEIFLYDDATQTHTKLYSAQEGTVSHLQSDGYLLFFSDGTKIHRIFLPDGTVEFVLDIGWDNSSNSKVGDIASYLPNPDSGLFTVRTNYG